MGFNDSASSSVNVSSISSSLSSSLVSSDLSDDASSSSTTTTTACNDSSSGPLYELADLMAQLPIKRGLSKFYHGKSKTFGLLSNARSVEDLGKKEMGFRRRMKSCKSYGGSLNIQHKIGPKPAIAKGSPRTACLSSSFAAKTTFLHI